MKNLEGLKARAKALRLHGLLAHWSEAVADPALAKGWIEPLVDWEEQERARRSLERRLVDRRLDGQGRHRTDIGNAAVATAQLIAGLDLHQQLVRPLGRW
jgi:hypothetical protein